MSLKTSHRTGVAFLAATALAGACLVVTPSAMAATTDWLDPNYVSYARTGATAQDAAADASGRLLVLRQSGAQAQVARMLPAGGIDTTYGVAGLSVSLTGHREGSLAVSGDTVYVLSLDRAAGTGTVTRLDASGDVDTSFGTGGRLSAISGAGQSAALAVRADGTVIVSRSFPPAGQVSPFTELRAYDPTGKPVTTWGTAGVVTFPGVALSIAVDGGRVVTTAGGLTSPNEVRRFTAAGAADTTFAANGVLPLGFTPNQTVVLAGALYVAGADTGTNPFRAVVAKFTDGGAPATFGTGGVASVPVLGSITAARLNVLVSDFGVYLVETPPGRPQRIHRFTDTGQPDPAFDQDGTLVVADAYGRQVTGIQLAPRPGGRIFTALDTRTVAADGAVSVGFETGLLRTVAVTPPGSYVALAPQRLLDTRYGTGGTTGPVGNGRVVELQVAGVGGVPADAEAVTLNVTAVAPTSTSAVTVYPKPAPGGAAPATSALNARAGRTASNLVTVGIGAGGKVAFKVGATGNGSLQLLADVAGYYRGGTAVDAGAFVPVAPARLLDTRSATGATAGRPVAANGSVDVPVTGTGGVPASNVSAVVLNVTAVAPAALAAITAYPSGTKLPTASNLNADAGFTRANLTTVKVGADGRVTLRNGSAGATHLVADVAGYYLGGTPSLPGTYVALTPSRILDTRSGVGAPKAALRAGPTVTLAAGGAGGVPRTGVQAVLLNTTITRASGNGVLVTFPSGTAAPNTSTLNFGPGQTVAALAAIKAGPAGTLSLRVNGSGTTDLIGDVSGYFRD